MKKALFLTVVLLFGVASAAFAVGNTSQQGSVLIFPKIDVTGSTDTYISISNGNNVPVWVHCYWVDAWQNWQDIFFPLTAYQPIYFSAKWGTGDVLVEPFDFGGGVGELKCWASDNAGNQINFNFLSGSAKVVDFDKLTAYEYNAWSFRAVAGTTGAAVGTAGEIRLDGVAYEACPQYLLGNFFSAGASYGLFYNTDLTLVPCKQDLRQDRAPTYTKAQFDIWNANEVQYSGAYKCFKCWFEDWMTRISPKFRFANLHTAAARFRVRGVASSVCKQPAPVATPLIGLLVETLNFEGKDSKSSVNHYTPVKTASTGFGAGTDASGFILFDPLGAPVVTPKK